jgi:hypothetical protein
MMQVRFFFGCMMIFVLTMFLSSCNVFRYGSTYIDAKDTYMLVDTLANNFGNKRLTYNKAVYKCELKKNFFCPDKNRKNPDFIYEYSNDKNFNCIEMFYINLDSVYVFEAKGKYDNLMLKDKRLISDFERKVYQKLKESVTTK